MAIEAPTNCWTVVENALAAALAELAWFQRFCEIDPEDGDAAERAAEFVFLEELGESLTGRTWSPAELEAVRHYAIVSSAPEEPFRLERATADCLASSGTLLLALDRIVPPEQESGAGAARENRNQQDRWYKNRVGSLLQELVGYWDAAGGPVVMTARVSEGPFHTHPEDRATLGHWQGCQVLLEWGVRTR